MAGAQNGIAYSDDGGHSWTRSNVWQPFRWWINDFVAPQAGPFRGTLFAAARDFNTAEPVVFASHDGGATWTELARLARSGFLALEMGQDFALYAGLDRSLGPNGEPGETGGDNLWRSTDGGVTWGPVTDGYDGECVLDLEQGSDGHLYLGGCSGMWRTASPLPVGTEAGPPEVRPEAALRVYPNPARDRLTLTGPSGAEAVVYDVLGRIVHRARLGSPVGDTVEVDVSGLAPGVYVVRTGGQAAVVTVRR